MNCNEAIELAEEAMDKDLPRAVKRRLDLHLSHCESCRRLFEAERNEHVRWFRVFNDPKAMRSLPPGFADRLAASVRMNRPSFWFRIPRWAKIAACLTALASFVSFAAVVIVENATDGDESAILEGAEAKDGTEATDAEPVAEAVPYVPDDPSVSSIVSTQSFDYQLEASQGEKKMNIKKKAVTALAAATLAAAPASATELPWTGGNATLGDGKVVILCDENGSVTNIVAKPTGGE